MNFSSRSGEIYSIFSLKYGLTNILAPFSKAFEISLAPASPIYSLSLTITFFVLG
jgi:hypothetical protein